MLNQDFLSLYFDDVYNLFQDLKKYSFDYTVFLMDKCTLDDFITFFKKHYNPEEKNKEWVEV
jgi:hypothetical protein